MSVAPEKLQPIRRNENVAQLAAATGPVTPPTTYLRDAWRRFRRNRLAAAGAAFVIFLIVTALFGPLLSPYTFDGQDYMAISQPPSAAHWFGTDLLGRDLLVRTLHGARISLAVGVLASLINLTVGVVWGGVAGFVGGRIDNVMMRIVDILYGVPSLLYIILLMVVLQPGLQNIMIAIGLTYWLDMSRIVRGQILSLKEEDFVLAARTIGTPWSRILLRHLLPNTLGPIIITTTLSVPAAIFTEAFLSFIGLGVPPPAASWGSLASEALATMQVYPWQLAFPATAISITILAFNFVGDGLRDALDPKGRK